MTTLIASKYTDLSVFIRKIDHKYAENFENTEKLEGSIHTLYMELIVKYGNCMQNTEKNGCIILKSK